MLLTSRYMSVGEPNYVALTLLRSCDEHDLVLIGADLQRGRGREGLIPTIPLIDPIWAKIFHANYLWRLAKFAQCDVVNTYK